MDRFVIDTNIIYSAMISPYNPMPDFIYDKKRYGVNFYAPKYLAAEIEKYRHRIREKSQLTKDGFTRLRDRLYQEIEFIDDALIPFEEWVTALRIVRDIDPNDAAFVALNNLMDATLWTGDLKLYNGLTAKGYHQVITFRQLTNRYKIR